VLFNFAKRIHSAGISASLSGKVSLSRVVAASVYIASKHVMTQSTFWLKTKKTGAKITLLKSTY
jgi:hypothetical protein